MSTVAFGFLGGQDELGMTGALLAVGCRALVAAVFVLTAAWKVSNGQE
jgi:hypothetical protein